MVVMSDGPPSVVEASKRFPPPLFPDPPESATALPDYRADAFLCSPLGRELFLSRLVPRPPSPPFSPAKSSRTKDGSSADELKATITKWRAKCDLSFPRNFDSLPVTKKKGSRPPVWPDSLFLRTDGDLKFSRPRIAHPPPDFLPRQDVWFPRSPREHWQGTYFPFSSARTFSFIFPSEEGKGNLNPLMFSGHRGYLSPPPPSQSADALLFMFEKKICPPSRVHLSLSPRTRTAAISFSCRIPSRRGLAPPSPPTIRLSLSRPCQGPFPSPFFFMR